MTFSLTTTVETKTLTAGNDTVDGSTLNSIAGDTITDGSSTDADVLNITIDGAGATVDPTIVANVETINVTAKYGSATVDGTKITGAKSLVASSTTATGSITVSGAAATSAAAIKAGTNVTTLTVSGAAAGTGTGGVAIDAGAAISVMLNGTGSKTDEYNLTLNGGSTSLTVEATDMADTADKVTITGKTAANTVTVLTAGAKTTVMAGDQSMTLKGDEAMFDGLTVTDATTAGTTTVEITGASSASDLSKVGADKITVTAGGQNLTFANNANVQWNNTTATTIVAGTGATDVNLNLLKDTADITSTTFTKVNVAATTAAITSLNLKVGTSADVVLTGDKDVTVVNTATAKTLNAAGLTGKLAVTLDGTTDITTITGGSGSDTLTTGTAASAVTADMGAGDDKVVLGVTPGTNKYVLDGGTGTDTLQATTSGIDFSAATALTSVIAGFEKIDVNGQTLTLTQKQLFTNGNTFTLTDTAGSGTFAIKDDGASSKVFDISGVQFASGVAAPTITIAGHATTAGSFTGSSAKESITGGAGNDTMVAGGGNDTLVGSGGNDRLTGGDGNDTFSITAGGSIAAPLVITDFVTAATSATNKDAIIGDVVGTPTEATVGTDLAAATTLTAALNLLSTGNGAVNAAVGWGVWGGDTYVVVDVSAGATFVDSTDIVIKLTGVTNLAAADLTFS